MPEKRGSVKPEKRPPTIAIKPELHRAFKLYAVATGSELRSLGEEALIEYLEKRGVALTESIAQAS